MAERSILIGTCGFPLARRRYFEQFPCIEINITFYQLPGLATARAWRAEAAEVNPDFEFIVKAWQLITHPVNPVTYRRLREPLHPGHRDRYGFFRPTPQVMEAWARTEEFCGALGARKVLFQTPPIFRPTPENLDNLRNFFYRARNRSLQFMFEPRGQEWTRETAAGICRECRLIHAVDPLHSPSGYGRFRYYRLHGRHEDGRIDYDYQYRDAELRRILAGCDRMVNYVMFNNSLMYRDARRMQALLRQRSGLRPEVEPPGLA